MPETKVAGIQMIDLCECSEAQLETAARILFDSFKDNWPDAWPTIEDAMEEIEECLTEDRIGRAALDGEGKVIGFVGGISTYNGNVWELHPLCVDPQHRGKGIGAELVHELERQVASRGGMTIYLGSDDESNQTSLGGKDIYDDTWSQIKNIKNVSGHPYTFYQKLGYKIVGVVPDANGYGKPDIMLAKRVGEFLPTLT